MTLPNREAELNPTTKRPHSFVTSRPFSASHAFSRSDFLSRAPSRQTYISSIADPQGISKGFEAFEKKPDLDPKSYQNKIYYLRNDKSHNVKFNRSRSFTNFNQGQNETFFSTGIKPSRKANFRHLHKALFNIREKEEIFKENMARLDKTLESFSNDKTWNLSGQKLIKQVLNKTAANGFQRGSSPNEGNPQQYETTLQGRNKFKTFSSRKEKPLLLFSRKSCMNFFKESDNFDAYLTEKLKSERETCSTTLRYASRINDSTQANEEPTLPVTQRDNFLSLHPVSQETVDLSPTKILKTDPGYGERERYVEDEISYRKSSIIYNEQDESVFARKGSMAAAFGSIRASIELDRSIEAQYQNLSPDSYRNSIRVNSAKSTRTQSPFLQSPSPPIHNRPTSAKKRVKVVSLSKSISNNERGNVNIENSHIAQAIQIKRAGPGTVNRQKSMIRPFMEESRSVIRQKPEIKPFKAGLLVNGRKYKKTDSELRGRIKAYLDERQNSSNLFATSRDFIVYTEQEGSVERRFNTSRGNLSPEISKSGSLTERKAPLSQNNVFDSWVIRGNERKSNASTQRTARARLAF